jgi:hypothetical protein
VSDCLDYLDARPPLPRGAELIRIRTELVELCREHCGPETVAEAEALLAAAMRGESPWRMRQLELFGEVA